MKTKGFVKQANAVNFICDMLVNEIRAKRTLSVVNATVEILTSTSFSIHAIGHGLAYEYGLTSKHSIKQVDRLLSNQGVDIEEIFPLRLKDNIGGRNEIIVILDWTGFEEDVQTTTGQGLASSHGRSSPLMRKSILKMANSFSNLTPSNARSRSCDQMRGWMKQ